MMAACGSNRLTSFSPAGTWLASQDAPLALCDDPFDQRLIPANLGTPECNAGMGRHGELRRRPLQIGQGRPGHLDQLTVELNPPGSPAGELDRAGTFLHGATMITP